MSVLVKTSGYCVDLTYHLLKSNIAVLFFVKMFCIPMNLK